jgi:hypothetical protein
MPRVRNTASPRALAIAAVLALIVTPAAADEGGISFWLPGQYGSLIAAPQQPGWSMGSILVNENVDGGGEVAASRQITIGGLPRDIDISFDASLDANMTLLFVSPTYTFANPVFGGQLSLGAGFGYGYSQAEIEGTLTLTGPNGGVITRRGQITDSRGGFSDLYPSASLRWNKGVHNYMLYTMGDIPIGTYDSTRLANVGIGHGAIDVGGAYTYFNPGNGREFSATSGFTYNFENDDTDYQNGVDWHLDWAATQFLSESMHVGLAGYFYQQLTADEGAPEILGDFKSSVMGIGPQMGFMLPVGGMQGYLNFKGLFDFDAENRAEGWSAWLTFVLSPHAEHHQ